MSHACEVRCKERNHIDMRGHFANRAKDTSFSKTLPANELGQLDRRPPGDKSGDFDAAHRATNAPTETR